MAKLLSSDDLDMTLRTELPTRHRGRRMDPLDDTDEYGFRDDDYDDDSFDGEITRMIQLDSMICVEWAEVESLGMD